MKLNGLALVGGAALLCACFSDEPTPPTGGVLYSLVLQPDALNLPVGGTKKLQVDAFDGRNQAIASVTGITYASTNTNAVKVDAAGTVSAADTGSARVIASVQYNGVTRADTIQVRVTPAAATPLASFAVSPKPMAVATLCTRQLSAVPTDANGAAITGLSSPYFTSRNPAVATVSSAGLVTGIGAGTANLVTTITSGGTTKSDSVVVTVGPVVQPVVSIAQAGPNPASVTIVAGCSVLFQNASTVRTDVTFTSQSPKPPSNVSAIAAGGSTAVYFNTAGTYTYKIAALSDANTTVTGTVVVQPAP